MSNLVIREHALLNDMRDPVLITAFSSLQKGGATATAALGYALEQLEAQPIAEIDAMSCYNFARMRPWVRREDGKTVVDWPRNVVYRYEAPEQTVLALIGAEPTLNWPAFVGAIGEFAQRAGVETAVNLKSAAAVVPHTAPAPVRAIYSEPGLVSEFGIQELEETDGPGDIGRILNLQLAGAGCRTVDIVACEPFYASATPDGPASLALVQTVERLIGVDIDTRRLEEACEVQRRAIDMATKQSLQLRDTVEAVEQRARETGLIDGGRVQLTEAPELETSDVLKEVESILGGRGQDTNAA